MIPATAVHAPSGFFATGGGYEYPALLGVSAAALTLMGPGDWPLDAQPDHRLNRPWMAAVAIIASFTVSLGIVQRRRRVLAGRAAEASSHALQGVPTGAEKHFGELHVADHRGGSDRVEQLATRQCGHVESVRRSRRQRRGPAVLGGSGIVAGLVAGLVDGMGAMACAGDSFVGLAALLHGATTQELWHLTDPGIDHSSRLGRRPQPTPLDPWTWTALHRCLDHRMALGSNNAHVLITMQTKATRAAASDSYVKNTLRAVGIRPRILRSTRLVELVGDVDAKLVANTYGRTYEAVRCSARRVVNAAAPPRSSGTRGWQIRS